MQSQSGLMRIPAVFFFPDSEYLSTKWWHRLMLVTFWIWLLYAAAVAIGALWDIWEGFSYTPHPEFGDDSYTYTYEEAFGELFEGVAYLLSVFVPVVVYRVLLFIGVGNAWKGEPAS